MGILDEDDVLLVKKNKNKIPIKTHQEDLVKCPCGIQTKRSNLHKHRRTRNHKHYEMLKEKFIKGEIGY